MNDRTVIPVGGAASYDVVVGPGATADVAALVEGARTVAIVRPPALDPLAAPAVAAVREAGAEPVVLDVADGEQGKSLDGAAALWDRLAEARMTRTDLVVAVGGGATTDVVGFVAATWLRGVRVVHVPTTLLGMVDAAIGGKTAINTSAGKNLVGAFHPPAGVLVDLDVLTTLPAGEWVNGMAEVVKAGFIADPAILDLVEKSPEPARRPDGPHSRELIERAIRVKAQVVTADLRDGGPREMLNYGHTLGHAIERAEGYRWPHGHAVSVGMVFAAELSRLSGRLAAAPVARHRAVLDAVGLPTRYDGADWAALRETMRLDKKSRGATLRFVVLEGIGRPAILADPDATLLESAYREVS